MATTSEPPKACMACAHFVGGRQLLAADQHLGAELEVPLGGDFDQRGGEKSGSPAWKGSAGQDRVAFDEADHALEHPDEAHATGVDHSGLLQHRHQLRRLGEGGLALPRASAA